MFIFTYNKPLIYTLTPHTHSKTNNNPLSKQPTGAPLNHTPYQHICPLHHRLKRRQARLRPVGCAASLNCTMHLTKSNLYIILTAQN